MGHRQAEARFLHVDDCADALVFLRAYSAPEHVNVGSGDDLTILDTRKAVAEVVGFEGDIVTDPTKPDGMPRKLLDSTRLMSLGWKPRVPLREGVEETYRWFLQNVGRATVTPILASDRTAGQ